MCHYVWPVAESLQQLFSWLVIRIHLYHPCGVKKPRPTDIPQNQHLPSYIHQTNLEKVSYLLEEPSFTIHSYPKVRREQSSETRGGQQKMVTHSNHFCCAYSIYWTLFKSKGVVDKSRHSRTSTIVFKSWDWSLRTAMNWDHRWTTKDIATLPTLLPHLY